MSALRKMLVTEVHRRKVHERNGAAKSPLVMNFHANPDISHVAVSNSQGNIVITENSGDQGVLTGFFELGIAEEDAYMANIIDQLFVLGCEGEWGSISYLKTLTAADVQEVLRYFEVYDLAATQVFCAYEGYKHLYGTGLMYHPNASNQLDTMPSMEDLNSWGSEYFMGGILEGRPVFLNEYLGPYIVFTTNPAFVGLKTRIDTFVSVALHNYERGIVIVRMEGV